MAISRSLRLLILAITGSSAAPRVLPRVLPRASEICYGESMSLFCYKEPNGTPQNVDVADVKYIGAYLRHYGRQNPNKPAFYTMLAPDTPDCAEWGLYTRGSAQALAKHIGEKTNTSVLYEDIANTIDGGESPTDASKAAAIIGCLSDGGSLGVLTNASNPAYHTTDYTSSGYTLSGILVKIVAAAPVS
ncbi:hypothetical protein SEUCBS139899_006717 [Sporothrix eucalyptigena]|uniref:Uncharacterized protein n=1 Tax=Sporothrix eucalyptigena TaxID=1812306 RepID=A0ABP0CIJ5_9PEZI